MREIVAALRPKPAAEPMIRRKPVRSGEETPEAGGEEATGGHPELSFSTRGVEPPKPAGSVEVARGEVYNFRFSAGKGFREKLERLAEVLGIQGARRSMPEIFEKALDIALEKKDPKKKLERRRKREAARSRTSPGEAAGEGKRETPGRDVRAGSRYIPGGVRERVLGRADNQCEYVGPGGIRCTARVGLEIDHIDPFGRGGGRGEENLRALCRAHNVFAAEREFGAEFMRGRIERAKIEGRKGQPRAIGARDTG